MAGIPNLSAKWHVPSISNPGEKHRSLMDKRHIQFCRGYAGANLNSSVSFALMLMSDVYVESLPAEPTIVGLDSLQHDALACKLDVIACLSSGVCGK